MKYLGVFLFTFLLFSDFSQAQFRDRLSRQQWKKELSETWPKKWCEPKGFYVSCYSISPGRCQKQIQELIKDCFPRLPASIDLHAQGVVFGGSIGRCVGEKFHEQNIDEYKGNSACKAAEKWKKAF